MPNNKKFTGASMLLLVVSIVSGVGAILATFGALWYWAILGMDEDVAFAWVWTVFLLGCMAVFAWIGADALSD